MSSLNVAIPGGLLASLSS